MRTTGHGPSCSRPSRRSLQPTTGARRGVRRSAAAATSAAFGSAPGASGRRRSATRIRARASGSAPSTPPSTPPGRTTSSPDASAAARPRSTSPQPARDRAAPRPDPRRKRRSLPRRSPRRRRAEGRRSRRGLLAEPETTAALSMDDFFDLTFPAAPPVMASSFTDSTESESGSPAKKLKTDDSSEGSGGGGATLEITDELDFDPFMFFDQLPYMDGEYESIDRLFAGGEAVQEAQDVNTVNNDMNGVGLWSFDEFPIDGALF